MATMNISRDMLNEALAKAGANGENTVSAERLPDGRPVLQLMLNTTSSALQVVAALALVVNEKYSSWAWAMVLAERAGIEPLNDGVLLQYIDVELGYVS